MLFILSLILSQKFEKNLINAIQDSFSFEWAKWAGKIDKDSNNEKNSIGITTRGKIFQTFPEAPDTNSIGEKVTIVVSTANITGLETS